MNGHIIITFQKVLLETVCEWSFHLNWAKLLLDTVYEWFQTFNKMVHIWKIIILLLFLQFPCHHNSFCWFPKKIASFVLWTGDFVIFCLMNILNRSDDTLLLFREAFFFKNGFCFKLLCPPPPLILHNLVADFMRQVDFWGVFQSSLASFMVYQTLKI